MNGDHPIALGDKKAAGTVIGDDISVIISVPSR